MCCETSRVILPEPDQELKRLSNELADLMHSKIRLEGPIPFSEYMEMALYEPGLGYYSAGLQKFGEGGDFVTAPQMGDVFARCMAQQIEQIGEQLGHYEIVEAGAGSGILAADLLRSLPADRVPARYRILERSAHLRQVQKETLLKHVPEWMDRIEWLDRPPEDAWSGILLANELLDALTVERFCIEDKVISRMHVASSDDGFKWQKQACPAVMQNQVEIVLASARLRPDNIYCSEINTHLPAWLDTVSASLQKGIVLLIDYGYPRREYYLPQRRDGTLICHYQQRAHDNPFQWPGLTDISASVDFTAVAEAADQCQLEVTGYTSQAMFLLACGLDQILAAGQSLKDKDRMLLTSQVRRLTLPGEMGERFQVMALSRGLAIDLRGFSLSDLCHRL